MENPFEDGVIEYGCCCGCVLLVLTIVAVIAGVLLGALVYLVTRS